VRDFGPTAVSCGGRRLAATWRKLPARVPGELRVLRAGAARAGRCAASAERQLPVRVAAQRIVLSAAREPTSVGGSRAARGRHLDRVYFGGCFPGASPVRLGKQVASPEARRYWTSLEAGGGLPLTED
jgi:hypothetical protein